MRGPRRTGTEGQTGDMRETGKGAKGFSWTGQRPERVLVTLGAFMIRLTDKIGISPAVNIINKQRNRNNPSSP